MRYNRQAFTLVELIVVIVILAILGTIAFLSFQGYSSSARDSVRMDDVASLSRTLDVYEVQAGSYPKPDNSFAVVYSGASVWNQGVIGSEAIKKMMNITHGEISEKPIDPATGEEYEYSTVAYGKGYQIRAKMEGSLSYAPVIIETAYAAGTQTTNYVKGTYNGLVARTQTGNIIYLIATPSILTSSGISGESLDITTLSGKLLSNGEPITSGMSFTPSVIYASGALPVDDTHSGVTNLVKAIQTVYSGTDIATKSTITNFLASTGSEIAPTGCGILKEIGGKCGGNLSYLANVTSGSGGESGSGSQPIVHDSWSTGATLPTSLAFAGIDTLGNKVYVFGGTTDSGNAYLARTEGYVYNVSSNTWSSIPNMSNGRYFNVAAQAGGKFYVFGGFNGYIWNRVAPVEEYDPIANTWTTKGNMPQPRDRMNNTVVLNGKIYMIGGYPWYYTNAVNAYNPSNDTWETLANLPSGRGFVGCATVGGKIYAIGGYNDGQGELSDVQMYDPIANTWTQKTPIPTARHESSIAVSGGKIYVMGGFGGSMKEVEVYDPVSDTWTSKTPMPFAVGGASTAALPDGKIMLVGGYTGAPSSNETYIYTP